MSESYNGPLYVWHQDEVVRGMTTNRTSSSVENRFMSDLQTEVLDVLNSENIDPLLVGSRIKPPKSIVAKLNRRGINPILDFYALQFVVENRDIVNATEAIMQRWPMPEEFPWGLPTVRDGQNPYSSPDYSATHINILTEGKIAEIKLLTPTQYEIERRTRSTYEKNRKLGDARIQK